MDGKNERIFKKYKYSDWTKCLKEDFRQCRFYRTVGDNQKVNVQLSKLDFTAKTFMKFEIEEFELKEEFPCDLEFHFRLQHYKTVFHIVFEGGKGSKFAVLNEEKSDMSINFHDVDHLLIINGTFIVPNKNMKIATKLNEKKDNILYFLSMFGVFIVEVHPNSRTSPIPVFLIPRGKYDQNEKFIVNVEAIPVDHLDNLEIDVCLPHNLENSKFCKFPFEKWLTSARKNTPSKVNLSYVDTFGRAAIISLKHSIPTRLFGPGRKYEIAARTMMKFKIIGNENKLVVTTCGQVSLQFLIACIKQNFEKWKENDLNYFGPTSSIRQGQNFEKTNLALALLKKHPGFYINSETCYHQSPFFGSIMNRSKKRPKGGRLLFDFAKCLTAYVINLTKKTKDLKNLVVGPLTFLEALDFIIEEVGEMLSDTKRMKMNDYYFKKLRIEEMKGILAVNGFSKPKDLTKYIKKILENPRICFTTDDPEELEICDLLGLKLKRFPFVFILDSESELEFNSREAEDFKRLMGFIRPGTNLFLLTIDKDALIQNIPWYASNSRRGECVLLPPIIMVGNTNIYSNQYPLSELEPTYQLLKNPLFVKFIITLGTPKHSHFWFKKVSKVEFDDYYHNLSHGYYDMFIDFHPNVCSSKNYVLDPVFVDQYNAHAVLSDPIASLFIRNYQRTHCIKFLRSNVEIYAFESEEMMESCVALMLLEIINSTESVSVPSQNDVSLEQIKLQTDVRFHSLWEKRISCFKSLGKKLDELGPGSFYKVYRVEDFLNQWCGCGEKDCDWKTFGITAKVLDSIINTNSFVRLARYSRDKKGEFEIDDNLLKLGLLRQCGFHLPQEYSGGFDIIIPVCLKEGGYSFIGISTKDTVHVDLELEMCKMRMRNHMKVKDCNAENEIYRNQITIIVNMNSEDVETGSSVNFSEGFKEQDFRDCIVNCPTSKLTCAVIFLKILFILIQL